MMTTYPRWRRRPRVQSKYLKDQARYEKNCKSFTYNILMFFQMNQTKILVPIPFKQRFKMT